MKLWIFSLALSLIYGCAAVQNKSSTAQVPVQRAVEAAVRVARAIALKDWNQLYHLSSSRVKRWFSLQRFCWLLRFQSRQIFIDARNPISCKKFGRYLVFECPSYRADSEFKREKFLARLVFIYENGSLRLDNNFPVDGADLPPFEWILATKKMIRERKRLPKVTIVYSWWADDVMAILSSSDILQTKRWEIVERVLPLWYLPLLPHIFSVLRDPELPVEKLVFINSQLIYYRSPELMRCYLTYLNLPIASVGDTVIRAMLPEDLPVKSCDTTGLYEWLSRNLGKLEWNSATARFHLSNKPLQPLGNKEQISTWRRNLASVIVSLKKVKRKQ